MEGGFQAEKTAEAGRGSYNKDTVSKALQDRGLSEEQANQVMNNSEGDMFVANSLTGDTGDEVNGSKGTENDENGGYKADNTNLNKVTQSKLSASEINDRLKLVNKIKVLSDKVSPKNREVAEIKAKAALSAYVLTDAGYKNLSNYKGSQIIINLVQGSAADYQSGVKQGTSNIQINIGGDGYAQVLGTNSYVRLDGLRLYAHEIHHATHQFHSYTSRTEPMAMEHANEVMRQYGLSKGALGDVGVREFYNFTTDSPPEGARIKETFTEFYNR